MSLIRGIAAKIFGLALFLLTLTILLAGVLLHAASDTQRQMAQMQQFDIPLQAAIARIEEYGLRRRMAFERWFGALNAAQPNPAIIREASFNYGTFTNRLDGVLAQANWLISTYPTADANGPELAQLKVLLAQLATGYPAVTRRQQELLALQIAGSHSEANALANLLNDQQSALQRQREQMLVLASALSTRAANELAVRHHDIMLLTIGATISVVLLGLIVAGAITLRLTRPVRGLIAAIQDVRAGKLETDLPVTSNDELGRLTGLFNYFVQELRTKEHVLRTFGRYIDPRVIDEVLKNEGPAIGNGERRRMTIVFADIAGFTEIAERLTPAMMVTVLNRHFTLQAEAIQARRGVVDKFVGDAVLAFWGPPFVPAGEQAQLAAHSVLAQLAALDTLRTEMPELTGLRRDPPHIALRVGVATGEVLVGNVGSAAACSFTVIGDTVNLASRIEGANKVYGTRVMVGEMTAHDLLPAFELREIDTIAVKGKRESTRVFELLGETGTLDPQRLRIRDAYESALKAYRACNWAGAERGFSAALLLDPDDGPSRTMLARVAALKANPPAAGWDGVWVLDAK